MGVNFSEIVQNVLVDIGRYYAYACIYLCENIIGGLNIPNRQNLLLANILSYTVIYYIVTLCIV